MENIRYSRLIGLPGVGHAGVQKLNNARVLVIGCGALGSLCSMYLAASGIGTVGIADFDTIDLSNLQRQLFFKENELGKSKCEILAERLSEINTTVKVISYRCLVNDKSARKIFPEYDFIIDGSDNPATKRMTAEVCEELNLPYCIGGVREFSGQVMTWIPGHSGYTSVFGNVNTCSAMTPCSTGGVLGPAAGIVASVQASEAIKYVANVGNLLTDKLFVFNLATPTASIF